MNLIKSVNRQLSKHALLAAMGVLMVVGLSACGGSSKGGGSTPATINVSLDHHALNADSVSLLKRTLGSSEDPSQATLTISTTATLTDMVVVNAESTNGKVAFSTDKCNLVGQFKSCKITVTPLLDDKNGDTDTVKITSKSSAVKIVVAKDGLGITVHKKITPSKLTVTAALDGHILYAPKKSAQNAHAYGKTVSLRAGADNHKSSLSLTLSIPAGTLKSGETITPSITSKLNDIKTVNNCSLSATVPSCKLTLQANPIAQAVTDTLTVKLQASSALLHPSVSFSEPTINLQLITWPAFSESFAGGIVNYTDSTPKAAAAEQKHVLVQGSANGALDIAAATLPSGVKSVDVTVKDQNPNPVIITPSTCSFSAGSTGNCEFKIDAGTDVKSLGDHNLTITYSADQVTGLSTTDSQSITVQAADNPWGVSHMVNGSIYQDTDSEFALDQSNIKQWNELIQKKQGPDAIYLQRGFIAAHDSFFPEALNNDISKNLGHDSQVRPVSVLTTLYVGPDKYQSADGTLAEFTNQEVSSSKATSKYINVLNRHMGDLALRASLLAKSGRSDPTIILNNSDIINNYSIYKLKDDAAVFQKSAAVALCYANNSFDLPNGLSYYDGNAKAWRDTGLSAGSISDFYKAVAGGLNKKISGDANVNDRDIEDAMTQCGGANNCTSSQDYTSPHTVSPTEWLIGACSQPTAIAANIKKYGIPAANQLIKDPKIALSVWAGYQNFIVNKIADLSHTSIKIGWVVQAKKQDNDAWFEGRNTDISIASTIKLLSLFDNPDAMANANFIAVKVNSQDPIYSFKSDYSDNIIESFAANARSEDETWNVVDWNAFLDSVSKLSSNKQLTAAGGHIPIMLMNVAGGHFYADSELPPAYHAIGTAVPYFFGVGSKVHADLSGVTNDLSNQGLDQLMSDKKTTALKYLQQLVWPLDNFDSASEGANSSNLAQAFVRDHIFAIMWGTPNLRDLDGYFTLAPFPGTGMLENLSSSARNFNALPNDDSYLLDHIGSYDARYNA